MKDVCFTVEIGRYNEIDVEVEVSEEEYPILCRCADEMSVEFSDCEELADLYRRVRDAAYDEMANGVYDDRRFIDENLGGEYDFDIAREFIEENYTVTPQWPDL